MTENINIQFTEWVNLYSDKLYSWAFHKTSNKEVAEDLVQETFLAAFKAIDNFKFDSQPHTWLFSILNNKIIDYYRKKSNNNHLNHLIENQATRFSDSLFDENGAWKSNEINSLWDDEKHLLDDVEFNATMEFCMGELPQKWRATISAKYILEKDTSEICQEMKLTTTNYWQILHRAKIVLKNCIEKHWKL